MKIVNLFIFDLDGTLVDTLGDITASLNFALSKLGRPLVPKDKVRQFIGDGLDMLILRALGDRQEFLDDARGIYTVHHSRNLVVTSRLYPGVAETLEHFRSVPMAVVTNKSKVFTGPLLEALGIRPYFGMVIGGGEGIPFKPAPDAYLQVLHGLGLTREHAVVVGDGTTDILAGRAAGMTTCAATYGFRSEEELRKAGPDLVINAFPRLQELFSPR